MVRWYHTYILHPVLYQTEAIICQHLFWPNIRESVQSEVQHCNSCQNNKNVNKKYGKVPTNLVDETLWNKLCVDLIVRYKICMKGEENLILNAVTIIDPVNGWFGVMQYNDSKLITIVNLVETTWISRHSCSLEITYNSGSEFIVHEF